MKRKFFEFWARPSRVYARIGALVFEAGWYPGEPPVIISGRVLEWFPCSGDCVLAFVQIAKCAVCVSVVRR